MSDAKVREWRDALLKADRTPCDCGTRSPQHSHQCTVGRAVMRAQISALTLVLGEPDIPGLTKHRAEDMMNTVIASAK